MPQRRNHKSRKTQQVHKDLKDLIRLQDNQALKREPRVADALPMRIRSTRLYTSVQTLGLGNITPSNASPTYGAFFFTLSALANAASYEAIFDAFRIVQVEVQFLPRAGISTSSSTLLTVIDYDDANALTAVQAAYSYDTLQVSPAGVSTTRVFSPKVAIAAYAGSTFSGYSRGSPWIDCASPATAYYGLKYVMNATTTAPSGPEYDVYATAIFQFKSQRG